MSSTSYAIREARKDEIGRVIDFLEEHHEKEDTISVGYAKKWGNKATTAETKVSIEEFMSKYTILIVVHDDDDIVGAAVICPAEDDLKKVKLVGGRSSEVNDAIIKIYIDSGFYEQFDPRKMTKIRKLAVHREHRGRGLAKKLIRACVDWSSKNNYETVFSLFSVTASKKAAESCGFVKFLDYDVRQLTDSKGDKLLADCSPNNVISLMTMKIR